MYPSVSTTILTTTKIYNEMEATFVIIGGGIAGVSCVETLAFLEPEQSIILISDSALIKTVTNLHAITRTLNDFDVKETECNFLSNKYDNVMVIHDILTEILSEDHLVKTKSMRNIKYKFLCLCMGAKPKLIPQASQFPQILGIRDTDSVETFVEKLKKSKCVTVVGNGGIASELIYKIKNAEIHWVIKDNHISATFVDPGAAEFFQSSLKTNDENIVPPLCKRIRYSEEDIKKSGAALGPDWYKNLVISGSKASTEGQRVQIHYGSEVNDVCLADNQDYILEAKLSNGDKILCDLIVSATGVIPSHNYITKTAFNLNEEGYMNVNEFMQTSVSDIYAAGDICNADWSWAKHWFSMKLWTQARQMGCYAAKCMSGRSQKQQILPDFCFEMFAHSTKLFGHKVILLGLYNGQKLGRNYEILLRMTKGVEYIKLVLENNKLQGAVLIGDTGLEETCENLILNQLDLSPFGDDILNPDIDIEDYFD